MSGSELRTAGSQHLCFFASTALLPLFVGLPLSKSLPWAPELAWLPFATLKRRTTGGYRNISRSLSGVQSPRLHGIRTRSCWRLDLRTLTQGSFPVTSRALMRDLSHLLGESVFLSTPSVASFWTIPLVGFTVLLSLLVGMPSHFRLTIVALPSCTRVPPTSHHGLCWISTRDCCHSQALFGMAKPRLLLVVMWAYCSFRIVSAEANSFPAGLRGLSTSRRRERMAANWVLGK